MIRLPRAIHAVKELGARRVPPATIYVHGPRHVGGDGKPSDTRQIGHHPSLVRQTDETQSHRAQGTYK